MKSKGNSNNVILTLATGTVLISLSAYNLITDGGRSVRDFVDRYVGSDTVALIEGVQNSDTDTAQATVSEVNLDNNAVLWVINYTADGLTHVLIPDEYRP